MKLVGITGGVASGKSTVRGFFEKLGALSLDADEICHSKLEEKREEIRAIFGDDVFQGGKINRRKLGKIIFRNKSLREKLESILHPEVKKEIYKIKEKFKETSQIVVCEIPLLYEKGWENMFDYVVVVKRSEEKMLGALLEKGLDEKEARARIQSQIPLWIKEKKADWVVDNQGTLEETFQQVKKIWRNLKKGGRENG